MNFTRNLAKSTACLVLSLAVGTPALLASDFANAGSPDRGSKRRGRHAPTTSTAPSNPVQGDPVSAPVPGTPVPGTPAQPLAPVGPPATTPPNTPSAPGSSELWVSPEGNDNASGVSRANALRSISEAWRRIPQGATLTRGVRISITRGTFGENALPNYWESRYGTAGAPIVIIAADGPGTVTFQRDLNLFDVRHVTVEGIRVASGGDAVHCEQCRNFTLRRVELDGGNRSAHETLKVNQSSDVVVEYSDIHGADDNAIDFVAVQRGRIVGNRIHDAGDWCAYVKGGSVDITVENNEIFNCGTGGFTAGQGTGLEFMVAPHLTYEAERIVVRANDIHDTEGAGLGVNGGSEIVLSGNLLRRVGQRSHIVEFGFGARSCDGDLAACRALLSLGAWGNAVVADGSNYVRIPNHDVRFEGNIVDNTSGSESTWQHFFVAADAAGSVQAGSSNNPNPARADDQLVIRSNTIRNGGADKALGIGDGAGCQPSNPACNETQLRRDNQINA